jgi:hypothetical protein
MKILFETIKDAIRVKFYDKKLILKVMFQIMVDNKLALIYLKLSDFIRSDPILSVYILKVSD